MYFLIKIIVLDVCFEMKIVVLDVCFELRLLCLMIVLSEDNFVFNVVK